jgi:hypothetical protein
MIDDYFVGYPEDSLLNMFDMLPVARSLGLTGVALRVALLF